jgi:PAS domain S-box-containing protein
MEENLRESEEKYSSVVENSIDGIIVLQKGIIKFFNQAVLNLIGYNLEELIDREFENLLSPEYRKLIMNRYQARLAGKDVPSLYEMEIIRKDGISVPIEVSNTTITYRGEKATLSFIRNITERKQAEDELRESEAKYRAVLEQSVDSIRTKC